ncbi:MAG: bifunctional 2-C-methyl-D-erythritol 4-phosphate cytidylyltransferase/2-C-methyl-D-erythritol 2,4-cyclodiphosphate synthase [Alphaproteobacteria bacterium]|nr:bifunctional 2-C-methyl-D-erythritol 4-phosphate cytidylyltransferase/2-C-methyl-D-erythritol 2,4-cyclodiphosphate synthase [Alphaproteobacteria bacterium]
MSRNAAIIVAAGCGSRIGSDMPKQYLPLGGIPVLRRATLAFTEHPGIASVTWVINFDDRDLYEESAGGLDLLPPVQGGVRRQDSVRLGLESLVELVPDKVLIHDAARPLVDADTITAVITALDKATGAIAAVPVTDTLKRASDGYIENTLNRGGLWRAQTPQGFGFAEILEAHRAVANSSELTDDAAVAEQAGLDVVLALGSENNLKITTQEDFHRAEKILMTDSTTTTAGLRVGSGFDVHRFTDGDHITICGVAIPHDRGLAGHSDADVGMHALTDAILGALGESDIGQHFPPSDARWKDANSEIFLSHAARLVAERRGRINYVDITLICEAPKLAPHRTSMITRMGDILGLPSDRISIKATTTERLGFTGRGEGIAAQATATISLPS